MKFDTKRAANNGILSLVTLQVMHKNANDLHDIEYQRGSEQ